MVNDEKLKKICDDFSLLSEEQQNYILGILQALVFANSSYLQSEHNDSMTVNKHDNS
ncbi:MAG: hypothetical protein LBC76_02165 [Treponema sp.]|jgi:hypothetical protein|nr:hypothetical protein [Treponema sp.]